MLCDLGGCCVVLLYYRDQTGLDVDVLQGNHLAFSSRIPLEDKSLHLGINLAQSALDEAVHD